MTDTAIPKGADNLRLVGMIVALHHLQQLVCVVPNLISYATVAVCKHPFVRATLLASQRSDNSITAQGSGERDYCPFTDVLAGEAKCDPFRNGQGAIRVVGSLGNRNRFIVVVIKRIIIKHLGHPARAAQSSRTNLEVWRRGRSRPAAMIRSRWVPAKQPGTRSNR